MSAQRWSALPCGADPERLLGYAADRAPLAAAAHESTCPYCQAALHEFDELWQPVREWAAEDAALPRSFMATVMHRVRRLAQSPRHLTAGGTRGATTVTSWVLGLIASTATLDTRGVTAVSPTSGPQSGLRSRRRTVRYGADGVEITEVDAEAVGVKLAITTTAVPNLAELADEVRRNVINAIEGSTRIEVADVNIVVDDVKLGPTAP